MHKTFAIVVNIPTLAFLVVLFLPDSANTESFDFFENRIRPALVKYCYPCHSGLQVKGNLRLDSKPGWIVGGNRGGAIVPYQPSNSLLMTAINYQDPNLSMPPKGKLPKKIIDDFETWIKKGANDPRDSHQPEIKSFDIQARSNHWCFQPVRYTKLPTVIDTGWPITGIDHFILNKLEKKGLKPSPQAKKQTLIRRLTYALIGLPPTPEEIRSFEDDKSATAYEDLVDRLLASPRFGEKWARHWMDLVRYAESYGHEGDFSIGNVWPYRDYLIRAFNQDIPYDQFVREHIAGDLLPEPRIHPQLGYNESVMGTAFYHLGEATHSPVDVKQDESIRLSNQIDVLSKTFLGLTVGCAQCHDHKFDPISTADYYALFNTLANSRMTFASIQHPEKLQSLTDRLKHSKHELKQNFIDTWPQQIKKIGYFLTALPELKTRTLLNYQEKRKQHNKKEDSLISDFESGTYEGWTVSGTAFGKFPASSNNSTQKDIDGFQGRQFANSYLKSDKPKGKLLSSPFKINKPYINFLIGGGNHQGKTCANLRIEGQIVHTQTGKNADKLEAVSWSVEPFMGKIAQFEIVDNYSGSWGHILIDHIFQSNLSTDIDHYYHQMIEQLATENENLKVDLLKKWYETRQKSEFDNKDHPLFHWWKEVRRLSNDPISVQDNHSQQSKTTVNPTNEYRVLGSLSGEKFKDWRIEATAFPVRPSQYADIVISGIDRHISSLVPSSWHSAGSSTRLAGALRSPTFDVKHDFIHIRAMGHGAQIRIVINNLQIIRGPLHGGLVHTVNSKKPTWHKFDLSRWKGHRAYVELLQDGGNDNFIATDLVVLHNGQLPVKFNQQPNESSLSYLGSYSSLTSLAEKFEKSLIHTFHRWYNGSADSSDIDLLNFLLSNQLLKTAENVQISLSDYVKLEKLIPKDQRVVAMTDGPNRPGVVYVSGDYRQEGASISSRFLEVLSQSTLPFNSEGSGRLELAESIISEENPLTARVMVNRIWHHLFGRGIVPTVDNFGHMGQEPSHPQLLDYLAHQFVHNKWSVKSVIREIVLSQVFQISSNQSAESKLIDPTNKLLQAMNVRRLESESIRDGMLAVSGRLNLEMYGPSVKVHLTPFMIGRGKPNESGPLDGNGRRSVYIEIRRNFLPAMMLTFDMPTPFATIGSRNRSNVPSQALTLMNDPFVMDQAKFWAKKILLNQQTEREKQIQEIFEKALSRSPSPEEIEMASEILKKQVSLYSSIHGTSSEKDIYLQSWTDLTHAIFNLKEFIYVF